jgi:hypothetical protein
MSRYMLNNGLLAQIFNGSKPYTGMHSIDMPVNYCSLGISIAAAILMPFILMVPRRMRAL